MSTEPKPVAFNKFGGLRLDLPLDEIGGEQAQYLRDVDWDGNTGRLRPRDGFQKLKAADASGPYKALFAHSSTRLLATKRISAESIKIVAIDKGGEEKAEHAWGTAAVLATFARFGTPSGSYTYCRPVASPSNVIRFDGTTFTEPTVSVDGVAGKQFPRGKFMAAWPDGGDRLIVANTGATGGPGGAASSNSHVWFSEAEGKAEGYESTAYLQLSPGDGEEITGLAVFAGQVFIFKETKFFVVYGISVDEEGRPIFNYREVSLGEGSRMKRPVVEALAESSDQLACVGANGVYFCTSDGIWVTTGSTPMKISQALRPLEEVSPFDGPMAEFLNGETEVFRWPATGIACLGSRLVVRRYEFMFVLDLPTGEWTCWKMPAVSMAIWTGLTGGGGETLQKPIVSVTQEKVSPPLEHEREWEELAHAIDATGALCRVPASAGLPATAVTGFSRWIKGVNPGFVVPETATVVGVQALAEINDLPSEKTIGVVQDYAVRLIIGGAIQGVDRSAGVWPIVPAPGQTRIWGGVEDNWGASLTPAIVNASNFGFAVVVVHPASGSGGVAHDVRLRNMRMVVYYLTAEAASGVRPRLYCTQAKSVFVTTPTAREEAGTRDAAWQSGFYDLGSEDEKDLVGVRAFGSGTIDAQSFSDFDSQPSVSEAHLEFPASGNRSVLDGNGLTDHGVMFSHKLSLEPGARIQRLTRYLRETRTPETKSR